MRNKTPYNNENTFTYILNRHSNKIDNINSFYHLYLIKIV